MITVFGELPDTADLRSSKVETRIVGPPAPPVVLWTRHTLSEGRGRASEWCVLSESGVTNRGIIVPDSDISSGKRDQPGQDGKQGNKALHR